ncbi:MAG: helix-turn-helix transcriptional regulator [Acidimicrobiaceae bacterium]|nr:helix-turn-helix transcriptional regulator [Acidimicrobiaceae bacterium]
MLGKDYEGQDCALARALEVIGERWTLLIIRDALYGVRRFNDFQAHLDIPKAILSGRLNGLVDEGVLERLPDPEHRGRHLYGLTPAGKDLWPVVHALLVWGDRHRERSSRIFTHADCGTRLDDSGSCPRCKLTPKPEDVVTEPLRRTGRSDPVAQALRGPHRLLDAIPSGRGPVAVSGA